MKECLIFGKRLLLGLRLFYKKVSKAGFMKDAYGNNINYSLFSKEGLLKAYETMLLIRRFEERCGQLYGMGQIAGFCHLYIGQEAVVVGVQSCLAKGDSVITGYRDHGHILACGAKPEAVMAELLGKESGVSRGKGGSMHLFDLEKGFYGGHGIVGAWVPIGTGIGFANKYRGNNNVSVTYFGDGSANQGQVYEAFNMAKLWNLPVLYIIENNEYAMGTSVERACGNVNLFQRGESFGIPGKRVDGMNIFAVKTAAQEALDSIRNGSGPILLEMKTYRYRGHSMSDPAKYRNKEEVDSYKENKDPIEMVARHLADKFAISVGELEDVDKRVSAKVMECVQFSQNSPEPAAGELYTDVYC